MISDKPGKHNLQVQVNNQIGISTLKRETGKTVATYIAAKGAKAATIREGLIAAMLL